MAVQAELFAAKHAAALARSEALEAGGVTPTGDASHLALVDLGPIELETLGEIVARAVRFGSGDLELEEVDLDHEALLLLPDFLCEALAELSRSEDPDLATEVATEWAQAEEVDASATELLPVLRSIVALVLLAEKTGERLYLWTAEG
ncbi:hypothetical protein J4G33_13910 [Actinotalea sp. BY-33]|uniref:Uncharacterized protein n=1 Tax=Actinotalea soli TaxID=2819234 RepID=A0A939RUP9_9CELL|nr:hypothetical protein [Actinotalea soli]MBO1752904.1 hypothetical protein [Actinotalea soli]